MISKAYDKNHWGIKMIILMNKIITGMNIRR